MCGHVGVFSEFLTEPLKKTFNDLLYLDVLRGEDSTGVLAVSDLSGVNITPFCEIFKSVGTPSNLYYKMKVDNRNKCVSKKANLGLLMGHNRFATQGKITDETAHPFEFENIVGAHNGTVSQISLRDFKGFNDFVIDSQIIFSHLDHTMDINAVWEKADGAMALVWWDKKALTLNMIRNKERTLYITYTKEDKALIWASEAWMISVAAMRNGVEIQNVVKIEDTDLLYTFQQKGGKVLEQRSSVKPFQQKFRSNWWEDWDRQKKPWIQPKKEEKKKINVNYKKIVPIKLLSTAKLFVTQFVDNAKDCMCFLETKEGYEVVIYITPLDYEEAKKKIIGRGKKGYYLCEDLKKCSTKDVDFYGLWKNVTWDREENKPSPIIQTVTNETAPWFDPAFSLTKTAWTDKTDCGCLSCDVRPVWADRTNLKWINREVFVCKSCTENPCVEEILRDYYGTRN